MHDFQTKKLQNYLELNAFWELCFYDMPRRMRVTRTDQLKMPKTFFLLTEYHLSAWYFTCLKSCLFHSKWNVGYWILWTYSTKLFFSTCFFLLDYNLKTFSEKLFKTLKFCTFIWLEQAKPLACWTAFAIELQLSTLHVYSHQRFNIDFQFFFRSKKPLEE